MGKFINLVRNEHEKIYAKKSIWICYGVLLLIVMFIAFGPHLLDMAEGRTMNDVLQECAGLSGFILMLVVVIGASNISSEYQKGTIKLLLIRPHSRWKILLSKYVTAFIFTLEMLVFLIIISGIFGFLGYGFAETSTISVFNAMDFNSVEMPIAEYLLDVYFYGFIEIFIMVCFALMLSSLFRTNAIAIGLTVFLFFAGSTIMGIFFAFDIEWGKYILFANTDLAVYKYSTGLFEGMTLGFSIAVDIAYLVAFVAIAWWAFCKRDVA